MKIIDILIRTFVTLDPSFDDTKENPASENSFSRTLSSYVSVHPKNDYFFHLHLAIRPIPFTNFNLFNLLFGRFPFAQLDLFLATAACSSFSCFAIENCCCSRERTLASCSAGEGWEVGRCAAVAAWLC